MFLIQFPHGIWRPILISYLTSWLFTAIREVKYLLMFLHSILSPVVTTHHTNQYWKGPLFKKACKDSCRLTLIKMLGPNITLTEELFKKQKLFINKSALNLFKFFILNLMISKYVVRCMVWYQMLKNDILMFGQNLVLPS